MITIQSAAGDVTVATALSAGRELERAGSVGVSAGGRVTLDGSVRVDCLNCRSGTVRVVVAEVVIGSAAVIDADGDWGGEIRFRATGGDLHLAGAFSARQIFPFFGAGIIEGTAAGDLTADGDFTCAPGGCIGLSAGGVLDTSGGTFDEPIVADCPGSPSGAFVD